MEPRPLALAFWLALLGAAVLAGPTRAQEPPRDAGPRVSPTPGQLLTLTEAIDLALRQHPTLRLGQESRTAATARVPQAQSAYYPKFDLLAAAGRSQVFSSSTKQAVQSNSIAPTLQGRQLLSDFGKTDALVDEARANVRVADAELERLREVVVLNVRQAYYTLLQNRRFVRVAEASLARSELNLRSARGFFEVGTKPKSDVTKAEVEVANARVAVIRARNAVRLAEVSLANAIGLETTVPFEVEDILDYEPVRLELGALLAEGLANRPELAQARARLEAARAQLAGARAGYRPDLAVTGIVGTTSIEEPPTREVWSIALTLSWNLFQGFFTTNKMRETTALLEVARANYDTFELQVRLEVEQAYIGVVEAAERIGATEKAVESAQENLRLAQGRYDAGVGTILDLTDAQLALTNAEADQVRALTDHKLALASLDRFVGRP